MSVIVSGAISNAKRAANLRNTQDAHRVLGERGADMTQHAALEIADAPMRIDQIALFVLGDSVDGEIAASEILLQRDFACRVHRESLVSTACLALGAGERILLVGLRMQEHREILAYWAEALLHHLIGVASNDDVVVILDRQAEQLVPDRPADAIGLHVAPGPLLLVSREPTHCRY